MLGSTCNTVCICTGGLGISVIFHWGNVWRSHYVAADSNFRHLCLYKIMGTNLVTEQLNLPNGAKGPALWLTP